MHSYGKRSLNIEENHIKFNFQWDLSTQLNGKTIKLLEEKKKSDFHMPKNVTEKINHEGSIDELEFVKITNLGSLKDHILNLLRY